jgi:hypothetical protein
MKHKLDIRILRRINDDDLKSELDSLLDVVSPCDFRNPGDFISDICDLLKDYFLDDIEIKTTPKTRDALYFYIVDKFGDYLLNAHKKSKC